MVCLSETQADQTVILQLMAKVYGILTKQNVKSIENNGKKYI